MANDDWVARLQQELRIRGFGRKTIESYSYHVGQFLNFVKKDPSHITKDDFKRYVDYLASRKEPSSVNLSISSVNFFFRNVLRKKHLALGKRLKKRNKLPDVLTKEEARRMIEATTNPKHKLILQMLYGCGLRLSEAVKLKKDDINFDEGLIKIRMSKGMKLRTPPRQQE